MGDFGVLGDEVLFWWSNFPSKKGGLLDLTSLSQLSSHKNIWLEYGFEYVLLKSVSTWSNFNLSNVHYAKWCIL